MRAISISWLFSNWVILFFESLVLRKSTFVEAILDLQFFALVSRYGVLFVPPPFVSPYSFAVYFLSV